jgi:formylglycine-generating enzyme required for sulfatase activity
MKLYQYFLGICLAWLCCIQGAIAQVSTGTGFLVAPGFLITNDHVVKGCTSVEVKNETGRLRSLVADADPLTDLALLQVSTLNGPFAKLRSPTSIELGEQVMVFGFPLSGSLTSGGNFTSGLVSGLRGLNELKSEFQITAPVQPGNSGGPVLDASGNVIGVVVAKLDALKAAVATGDIPQNINFAVTAEALNAFLIKNKVNVDYSSASKPLNTASIAKLAQSFTYQIECMSKTQQANETPKSAPRSASPSGVQVFKDCYDCPEMILIPAGSFLMGSPPDLEQDPLSNAKLVMVGLDEEKPQHRVQIQAFAIGKYEVTQQQWYAVMGNNPSYNKGSKLPVDAVSWDDTQLFLQKLSQKTGKKYRLPTEAEWEYAARAGSTTIYPWGNSDAELHVYAWSRKEANMTNPVGLKRPNQFGLHDMIGNVLEWTQDCWNENYIGAPTDGSAWTIGVCSRRVLRGGAWFTNLQYLRTANRDRNFAGGRVSANGFRLARTP